MLGGLMGPVLSIVVCTEPNRGEGPGSGLRETCLSKATSRALGVTMASAGKRSSPPVGIASTSFSVIRGRFIALDEDEARGSLASLMPRVRNRTRRTILLTSSSRNAISNQSDFRSLPDFGSLKLIPWPHRSSEGQSPGDWEANTRSMPCLRSHLWERGPKYGSRWSYRDCRPRRSTRLLPGSEAPRRSCPGGVHKVP